MPYSVEPILQVLAMKLVRLNSIDQKNKVNIDLIVGVHQGEPAYIARWKVSSRQWNLYQSDGRNDQGKLVLNRAGYLRTMDDILAFYRGKNLVPFCPKPQKGPSGKERRRHPRKTVDMIAEYLNHRTQSDGVCIVEDISVGGLNFKTISKDDISLEDRIFVKIYSIEADPIERISIARHVDEIHIGVEFIDWKSPKD